jgi:oxygen-dependent protoporphyrinogen oxidase
MQATRPRHLVVIGAGLAGLAAAEKALDGGGDRWRVTIVEPAGRPGGIIQTIRRDGWLVERSADSFLAARPEAVSLVERLGLADQLIGIVPRHRRALVLHRGRPQPVPEGFRLLAPGRVGAILRTPLLSSAGKLRLCCERLVPPRPAHVTDESLQSFAERRLGREAFEALVQPLAAGIWTADPARLSMAAACPEFFAMERRAGSLWAGERRRLRTTPTGGPAAGARYGQFLSLAEGLDTVPRRLAEMLVGRGIRFVTAAASAITRQSDGRWSVQLAAVAPDAAVPEPLTADAVVVATPAARAQSLLRGHDAALADAIASIPYAGSAVVSLGFSRADVAHPLDAAGMVVPRREGRRLLAVSFSSSKFPGRAPDGAVLMRSFVGGALDPEAATIEDDPLIGLVLHELRDLLGVAGRPLLAQVDRWHGAMPQYEVGHLEKVARIEHRLAGHTGLALAGAAYEGVGIPQTIASGQAAAARVLAFVEKGHG